MRGRRTNPLWLLLGLPLLFLRSTKGKLLLLLILVGVAVVFFWPRGEQPGESVAGLDPEPAAATSNATADPSIVGSLQPATISRVVDGDTFDVQFDSGGGVQRVRIIGVDTPETVHPRKPVQCFGREASAKTKELLTSAGNRVYLEKDVSETDRYRRLLRYAWIDLDGQRVMLNELLVQQGYAQISTYPPDVKYKDRFLTANREARAAKRGLWSACVSFGEPAAEGSQRRSSQPTRVSHQAVGAQPANPFTDFNVPANATPRYDPRGQDRDCGEFANWQEAQTFYEVALRTTGSGHALDGDGDGTACESLPFAAAQP